MQLFATLKHDDYSDGSGASDGKRLIVQDSTTANNAQTLTLSAGRVMLTKDIENIVADRANLDTRSFDAASGLLGVSGSHLALHGTLTDATKVALSDGKVQVNTLDVRGLELDAATATFDMSKMNGSKLIIDVGQCKNVSVTNVSNVSIYGTTISTKLVEDFNASKADSSAPAYSLYGENGSDTINMSGYSENLNIYASGIITGGDGGNYIYGRHGTQTGGAGNDTLYFDINKYDANAVHRQSGGVGNDNLTMHYYWADAKSLHQEGGDGDDTMVMYIYRSTVQQNTQNGGDGNDTIKLSYDPSFSVPDIATFSAHKMTGGAGNDAFELVCNMDSVLKEPHETNTKPAEKLIITDFAQNADTLDLSAVWYTRMNPETEKLIDIKYKDADFVADKVEITAAKLDEALNEVAKTITTGKIGYFHQNSNTYIFGNNDQTAVDKGDLLIELTGVTVTLTTDDLLLAS